MIIKTILSDRHYQNWPSWHIVYEWEDEISKSLKVPVIKSPTKPTFLYRNFKRIDNIFFKGKIGSFYYKIKSADIEYSLYFEMKVKPYRSFSNLRKTIPVIIDFWDKSNIEQYKKLYANCPFLLITNLEVLDLFKKCHFKNRLVHFPMSLPTIYQINPDQIFEKKYDIVIAGRKNKVLWNYLKEYEKKHPEIEYLYQVQKNGILYYESNKNGILGKYQSRSDFMKLIRSAKVAFYSTPGIDGGEERTNGFNPVTPRFLELVSAGCNVIARYPKTVETDYYKLDEICPSINSYAEFENQLNSALTFPAPIKKYAEYLKGYYTSINVEIIKNLKYE